MGTAAVMVSVGDHGVLNKELGDTLSAVWLDRDPRWLDFNDRVLAEALDERQPLPEWVKFLAIFTSNLDEFYMKRVSMLRSRSKPERAKLLAQVRERLLESLRRQAECFRQQIVPELARHGIHLRKWDELTEGRREEASRYFDAEISPALTPLVFDPVHAFPFLANLSTSLALVLYDPREEETAYARVKVPSALKQWIAVEEEVAAGERVLVPLYELIRGNIDKLYGSTKLSGVEMDDDSRARSTPRASSQSRKSSASRAPRFQALSPFAWNSRAVPPLPSLR
jgi:polyphosphate kinase